MDSSPFGRRLRNGDMALPEGIEVGLVGGLTVAAVFLARDLLGGNWLHTPSVLGTLLLHGPDAARQVIAAPGVAALYNVLHFAAWMLAGVAAVAAIKRAEVDKGWRFVPWAGLVAMVFVFVGLDLWVRDTGLGRAHLWLGGVTAAAAVAAMLAWRHPGAVEPDPQSR